MTLRKRLAFAAVLLATGTLLSVTVVLAKKNAAASHRVRAATIAEGARAALQQALDEHLAGLSDLSLAVENNPPRNEEDYRDIAVNVAVRTPAFSALNFLDHRFIETYVHPYGPNLPVVGMDLKTRVDALPAAHRAVAQRKPSATDLVPLAQGGTGFLVYAPVRRKDRWEGLIEGALDRKIFVDRYAAPSVPKGHAASLLDETGERPFYESQNTGTTQPGPFDYTFTVRFADRRWWGVLHPLSPPTLLWSVLGVMLLELGVAGVLLKKFFLK